MDWSKGLPVAHDPYVGMSCHCCGKLNKTTSESEDKWYYLRMTPMTGAEPGPERERIVILCRDCGNELYLKGRNDILKVKRKVKSKTFTIRLTEDEYNILKRSSEKLNISMSEYVRIIIFLRRANNESF